ncbi:M48 family metallopeptidase [Rheinheimera texasensis]|uniref:M48 family metallopeptidase n=1 Tax=Rheinheimera texasensis TaxID=306205 RepID=UPI00068D4B50|nr:M48 family metallopeptidase [Rheinheimera texasensis]
MNFFEAQQQARSRTRLLVLLFSLAVLLLVALTDFVVLIALAFLQADQVDTNATPQFPWGYLAVSSLAVVSVIGAVVLFRLAQLKKGGKVVAEALGGRRLKSDETDPKVRVLQNVVSEMAIAAGVPAPPLYVLADQSINAFAAGFSPADAVIGVTEGTLNLLSRDELQGVIAHEFSHILNGDMRLNLRLLALLHGILFISEAGQQLLQVRSSGRDRNGGILVVFGVGLSFIIIGYIGVLFGQLIKAAVSRQREFLADASAVQFTRNPAGIGGALKRIAALQQGGRVKHPQASEMSHLFFADALSRWQMGFIGGWFATHPPLTERIKRIEPHWIGGLPDAATAATPAGSVAETPVSKPLEQRMALLQAALLATQAGTPTTDNQIAGATAAVLPGAPDSLLAQDLTVQRRQLQAEFDNLPPAVRHASQHEVPAQALLCCCLMREQDLPRQLKLVQGLGMPCLLSEVDRLFDVVQPLQALTRLTLLQQLVPTLKQLSQSRFTHLQQLCRALIDLDGRCDTFEALVWLWLEHVIAAEFEPAAQTRARHGRLTQVLPTLLPLLHWVSQQAADEAMQQHSWQAGLQALELDPATINQPQSQPLGSLQLLPLINSTPMLKQQIWLALRAAVAADGQLLLDELLVLQGVALLLEIPIDSAPAASGF